jgi:hypothetical protein
MFKKAAFLTPPVWLVLVALGSVQVWHADEQHKSFLQSINSRVETWILQLDSIEPRSIIEDFHYKLTLCSYGWTLTCRKIGPGDLFVSPDTPEPSAGGLSEVMGAPAALWYTVTRVLSAGWLATLVFGLALLMAIVSVVKVKRCRNVLFAVWFPSIISVLAWTAKVLLVWCFNLLSGLITLLIFVFAVLSWVMWIKDIKEAGEFFGLKSGARRE